MPSTESLIMWGVVGVFIFFLVYIIPPTRETFYAKPIPDPVDTYIVEIYQQVLQRQPSGKEIASARNQIESNDITLEGLRKRLIDSEEYERLMKTQSNVLAPELTKMISDENMLVLIKQLYLTYRQSTVPKAMLLPLKDVYIYVDYNRFKLSAILKHDKYPVFEKDVLSQEPLTKDYVIERLLYYFDMKEIAAEADRLRKEYEAQNVNDHDGANSYASVHHQDTDSSELLKQIMKGLDESQRRQQMCAARDSKGRLKQTSHANDMVLNPEFEWSVPQPRPPICTTLGEPALDVQPIVASSKLMLGTPLNEAHNKTGVGSVMPPFEYKEYIDTQANAQKIRPYDSLPAPKH